MYDDVALGLAALWAFSIVAFAFIVIREVLHMRRTPGQGAPRFAPDPAFDLALAEDDEVAALDAIYELPTAAPRAW